MRKIASTEGPEEAEDQPQSLRCEKSLSGEQQHEMIPLREASSRQRLLSLADVLSRMRNSKAPFRNARGSAAKRADHHTVLVNSATDTAWAQPDPALARLTHVFHQEWHGIRAASGYAPGQKIAITADRQLASSDLQRVVAECAVRQTDAIVFQGFSGNSEDLIRLIRREFGRSIRLYCVWHGSTSQFHFNHELDRFARLIELRAKGVLDGVGCVKPQMHLLSPHIHVQTVLNYPPRIAPENNSRAEIRRAALIPTPNNWWKNFYSNLFVAANSPRLDAVYVTSAFARKEHLPIRARVVNIGPLRRPGLFRIIRRIDVMLNVTLSECQPMSALEGIAHGVPCLTGPLSLGTLDEHPYQRLVQVAGTGSLGDLSRALDRLLEMRERHPAELAQMLKNYSSMLCAEASRRYLEFTQS